MCNSWLRPICRGCCRNALGLLRTALQITRPNGLGIWLPFSHAPLCIVTIPHHHHQQQHNNNNNNNTATNTHHQSRFKPLVYHSLLCYSIIGIATIATNIHGHFSIVHKKISNRVHVTWPRFNNKFLPRLGKNHSTRFIGRSNITFGQLCYTNQANMYNCSCIINACIERVMIRQYPSEKKPVKVNHC